MSYINHHTFHWEPTRPSMWEVTQVMALLSAKAVVEAFKDMDPASCDQMRQVYTSHRYLALERQGWSDILTGNRSVELGNQQYRFSTVSRCWLDVVFMLDRVDYAVERSWREYYLGGRYYRVEGGPAYPEFNVPLLAEAKAAQDVYFHRGHLFFGGPGEYWVHPVSEELRDVDREATCPDEVSGFFLAAPSLEDVRTQIDVIRGE